MPAPVKSTRQAASHNAPVLGSWREGRFDFTSPAAREAWHRAAFAQGIDPETWHLGAEVDDKTRHVIAADLAGPMPPFYHGPDGRPRFGNLQTIERPTLRDIRARSFRGKPMSAIETAYANGSLPGEDEAVGHVLGHGPITAQIAAASSSFPAANTIPANSNMILTPENKRTQRAELLNSGSDGGRANDTRSGKQIMRLAQADNTGIVSDAVPDARIPAPAPANPVAGTLGLNDGVLTYPSGTSTPSYPGEKKAHGKKETEAERLIPQLQRATYWPLDGDHRLNERQLNVGQGDGRYGDTRAGNHTIHNGIDMAASIDDPIYAVKEGVVVSITNDVQVGERDSAKNNHGFGNEVIIRHADGTYTQYAHMSPAMDAQGAAIMGENGRARVALKNGQKVSAGQVIGAVGRTGNVPGGAHPHLHFEVRIYNDGRSKSERTTIHPFYYLPAP